MEVTELNKLNMQHQVRHTTTSALHHRVRIS